MNITPVINPVRRRPLTRLALLAIASVVAACGSDSPAGPASGAHISVINGAPGAVRVVVDGTTRIESLSAASVSTAIDVGSGSHTVELQAIAGGTLSGTSAMQVATAQSATAFVTAQRNGSGALVAGVVSDTGAVPADGMTKLSVINLAASAPALDVWRTQPDYTTPIRIMFPFPYGAQSEFVQSTPGIWEVIVTTASPPTPGEPDPRTSALATLSVAINANVAQTLVILDKLGGGVTVSLLAGN
jgi:ABC-type glycerol-3-phosphate transport system substrate-binding protein